jgi:serine/threonine-protein kinase
VGASAEPSDPEVGALIGDRYRIIELLGRGGMGAVYRAEHLQLAKPVAIKLLRPEISARKDADQRFQREALAGARLTHPNVVGVIDFGHRDDGSLYLVMELLQGESLRARLDASTRMPWPRALHIARQLLRGLGHAHDQGVIHRDIKPENIYLSHDGEDPDVAKLIDFGIALLTAGEGADVKITAAGLAVGTPTYLAPEQAVGGTIGPATDLYSLSVVLFEMIAGRPPFVADEAVRLLTAHAMTPPPTINGLEPAAALPPAVEAVIQRGLGKTWSERYTSAAEYIAAIDDARRAAGIEISNPAATRYQTPVPGTLAVATPPAPVETMLGAGTRAVSTPAPTAAPAAAAPGPGLRLTRRQLRVVGAVAAGILAIALGAAILGDDDPDPGGRPRPASAFDKETALKALLHDLSEGATCEDRRRAVIALHSLGDARAIPALKKARSRVRGGMFGLGGSNTNKCLRADAEAAIVGLGGSLK